MVNPYSIVNTTGNTHCHLILKNTLKHTLNIVPSAVLLCSYSYFLCISTIFYYFTIILLQEHRQPLNVFHLLQTLFYITYLVPTDLFLTLVQPLSLNNTQNG